MNGFEVMALNWYHGKVNRFTLDGGLVSGLVSKLAAKTGKAWTEHTENIFFKAMEMIYATTRRIEREKRAMAEAAKAEQNG